MAIKKCGYCTHGTARVFVRTENWWERTKVVDGTCPQCGGVYKWRDPPDEFTQLEELPKWVLSLMAFVRPWYRLDADNGRLWFIEGPGIPCDPERLLELMILTSQLGNALEKHNWLVSY
jgi:hypothetical protein